MVSNEELLHNVLEISAGAGIHVNHGVSIGSLPNNDMVISTPSSATGSVFRFLFFCISDSMMSNVGMLIGPNGTAVTTAPIFSIAHILLGILRVYSNALTASDQGVYTCRIPLQSGELGTSTSDYTPVDFLVSVLFFMNKSKKCIVCCKSMPCYFL